MTEEQLNKLSIYELRTLGRNTGVASPTSKCKAILIREIIEINSGLREKHVPKTRQGRPPKNFVGYGLINNFTTGDHVSYINDRVPSYYASLAQATPTFIVGDVSDITGYVEFVQNNSVILRPYDLTSRDCVYIPFEFVQQFNLRPGDLINCEIDSTTMDSPAVCKDIWNINACPITKYSTDRLDYFKIRHIKPTHDIEFKDDKYAKLVIKHGESVCVHGANYNENTASIIELLNSVKNSRKLYINPAVVEKNKSYIDDLVNTEKFISPIIADTDSTKRILSLAINRARRILERGDRVVVVIDDVKTIASLDEDLYLTKNLLSLTKDGENAGSITVIALMPDDDQLNTMFEKLFDVKLELTANGINKCE